jgi:hypothetical protein
MQRLNDVLYEAWLSHGDGFGFAFAVIAVLLAIATMMYAAATVSYG